MDQIKTQLLALGINTDKMDEAQLRGVAKAMNIKCPPKPRQVKIVKNDKNGYMYVSTDAYTNLPGKSADKESSGRPLYIRVETLDDAIADLVAAKGLLQTK